MFISQSSDGRPDLTPGRNSLKTRVLSLMYINIPLHPSEKGRLKQLYIPSINQ